MKIKGFGRQLTGFFIIIFLSIILLTYFSDRTMRLLFENQMKEDLKEMSDLVLNQLPADYPLDESLDLFCKQLGEGIKTRYTFILPDGRVIGDSQADISEMNNHGDRPEFIRALTGEPNFTVRTSSTIGEDLYYYALPLYRDDKAAVILRTSVTSSLLDYQVKAFYGRIIVIALIIFFFAVIITIMILYRLNSSLSVLTEAAREYGKENFDYFIQISKPEELVILGGTMTTMARTIKERLNIIQHKKNELSAILSSMVEAVIVLDNNLLIEGLNAAALELVPDTKDDPEGRSLIDVYRNNALLQFARDTLAYKAPLERDIPYTKKKDSSGSPRQRYLQAHGTVISDIDNETDTPGYPRVIIVLNDITRNKEAEQIRKDFVANVSHELKTPITSIKGFVETLLDGAVREEETADRFLNIIYRQTEQLNALIDDLLSLSRLDQNEDSELEEEEIGLDTVIMNAAAVLSDKAKKKRININPDVQENLTVKGNPVLLEQAVVNLIDNAVKYSSEGTTVTVTVRNNKGQTEIKVKDQGRGIPEEDLPRIFERFYRVDKDRSRESGGTGLGLAIVKHIVLSHKGEIKADSQLGEGSEFTIILP